MSDEYDPYNVAAFPGERSKGARGPAKGRPGKALSPDAPEENPAQTVAANQLRAFVERVEAIEEDIGALQDDRKEIFAEAKATGFDTKALRAIIRLRKRDPNERAEEEAVLDLYKAALGMA